MNNNNINSNNNNNMLNNLNVPQRTGFTLPNLDNGSSSSLMDAVVGGQQRPTASAAAPMPKLSESHGAPFTNSRRVNGATNDNQSAAGVSELERNLQKRRSLIPHLENELAELEAQIKAAEEHLAQAGGGGQPAATAAQ